MPDKIYWHPCEGGCTLKQIDIKTHSKPAQAMPVSGECSSCLRRGQIYEPRYDRSIDVCTLKRIAIFGRHSCSSWIYDGVSIISKEPKEDIGERKAESKAVLPKLKCLQKATGRAFNVNKFYFIRCASCGHEIIFGHADLDEEKRVKCSKCGRKKHVINQREELVKGAEEI